MSSLLFFQDSPDKLENIAEKARTLDPDQLMAMIQNWKKEINKILSSPVKSTSSKLADAEIFRNRIRIVIDGLEERGFEVDPQTLLVSQQRGIEEEEEEQETREQITVRENIEIMISQRERLVQRLEDSFSMPCIDATRTDTSTFLQFTCEEKEELIDNILNDSLVSNKNNLDNVISNAAEFGVSPSESQIDRMSELEIRIDQAIANIRTPDLDNIPTPSREEMEQITQMETETQTEIGSFQDILDKLKIETSSMETTTPEFPGDQSDPENEAKVKEGLGDLGSVALLFGAALAFSEPGMRAVATSRGSFAGHDSMFAEPFLIELGFEDGSTQRFVVTQQEFNFISEGLGPDNTLRIIEDQGAKSLEDRVTRNEQNLLKLGRDATDLGQIAVRQDQSLEELWNNQGEQWRSIDDLWEDQERQNTQLVELGDAVSDASGGASFGSFLGGLGIGGMLVLGLVLFLVLKFK